MFRSFFATALLGAAAALLTSQPRGLLAQSADGVEVSFRVLCFEHRDEVASAFAAGPDGAKIEVPFYTSGLSNPIRARFQGGRAAFFVEESAADGSSTRRLVASGKLADGNRQAFLLVPTDDGKEPLYRIIAFDDREEAFPMGATRVINLARFPIRLNLAGADMEPVKPGGISVFPIVRKVDDWNMFTARIDFRVNDDQWVEVSTQSWKASDRKRDWVITRFDEQTRQPTIRLYQDIPPWREAKLPTETGR